MISRDGKIVTTPNLADPDFSAGPVTLGVVAIGRNEGARLRRCLESLRAADAPVVYVDSGSTDGSVALAEAFGARVARLDPDCGFTAGKARNLGFATLADGGAPPEFVQFIDGDCEIAPGWIDAALTRLRSDPGLAAVAGRRHERAPGASIFNRLCDMEWNTPVGPADAVGGDAVYRAAAFHAAGGFNPSLIAGEEPELCLRLRRAGWRIERLDQNMALHDAAMTRWGQWRRRTMRGGWATEEGFAMHGDGPEGYRRRERRSLWLWGAAAPAAIVVAALGAAGLAATGLAATGLAAAGSALWPAAAGAAVAGLAAYPAMALRVARNRRARSSDPWRHALLYGALIMAGKPVEALGAAKFRLARRRGGQARLIEYKGT